MAANTVYDHDSDQQAIPDGVPWEDSEASTGSSADPRSRYNPQKDPKFDSSDPRASAGAADKSELGRKESTDSDDGRTGKLSALDAPELASAEKDKSASGGGAANSLYNAGIASTGVPGAVFNKVLGFAGKRKKSGIASLIAVAFLIAFISISNGPLEFMHIAQLLEKFHFSAQEDAQDNRLTRLARYAKDPSKPQNTRLGLVGNAVANKLEAKMHEATGLRSSYDTTTGASKGYVVDRDHSNFKGMSAEQVKEELIRSGIDPDTIKIADGADGRKSVSFNPDTGGKNLLGRYQSQTKTSRSMLKKAGLSKFGTIAGTRVLGKRAGWTFHPIRKADSKLLTLAADGSKSAREKLKEQFAKDQLNFETNGAAPPGGDPKAQTDTDTNGNQTTDPESEKNSEAVKEVKEAAQGTDPTKSNSSKELSGKLGKIAGGAAGGVGLACVVRGLSEGIDQERQAKVVLPMMRKASQIISLGSQVQSNDDLSVEQLGIVHDFFDEKDADGNVVSSWASAASIQYENGQPVTGKDLPESAQVFNKGNPFDFFDNTPVLGTACKILGGTFGTLFGIVTGPINFVISSAVLPHVLGLLTNWLSGAPISPIASGADYGNYINYGARLSANDQYASAGGVPLSADDELALKTTDKLLDQQDFKTKNIAYRVFNTRDSRTLAAQFIDNNQVDITTSNVASSINKLGTMFGSFVRMPALLVGGTANAASTTTYSYHGLKKVGFSTEELTDSTFANPYDNGCRVVGGTGCTGKGILEDAGKAAEYTDRVQKCFGINMSFDGSMWSIDAKTEAVNLNGQDYPSDKCTDSNPEWKRIRFWLLDTATVESYDCIEGGQDTSDQSCVDVGATQSLGSSGPTTTGGGGSAPTGSSKDLAKKIEPYIQSGKIKCGILDAINAGCADITKTANGTSINGVGGCTVEALTPELLGMLLKLLQDGHSYEINALCSDHHQETGRHSAGLAADFGKYDGATLSSGGSWTGAQIETDKKLTQDIAAFMPKSTEFLQQQCHSKFDFLSGFQGASILGDPCNHQHITAGK